MLIFCHRNSLPVSAKRYDFGSQKGYLERAQLLLTVRNEWSESCSLTPTWRECFRKMAAKRDQPHAGARIATDAVNGPARLSYRVIRERLGSQIFGQCPRAARDGQGLVQCLPLTHYESERRRLLRPSLCPLRMVFEPRENNWRANYFHLNPF
jgi:hypothetical protein